MFSQIDSESLIYIYFVSLYYYTTHEKLLVFDTLSVYKIDKKRIIKDKDSLPVYIL